MNDIESLPPRFAAPLRSRYDDVARAWVRASDVPLAVVVAATAASWWELTPAGAIAVFLLLCVTPALAQVLRGGQTNLLDPLLLVSASYALAFPIAYLTLDRTDNINRTLISDWVDEALRWSLRGYAVFVLGYVLARRLGRSPRRTTSRDAVGPVADPGVLLVGAIGTIGVVGTLMWTGGTAPVFMQVDAEGGTALQILNHALSLGYSYVFLYVGLVLRRRATLSQHVIFGLLATGHLLLIVGAGSKAAIMAPVIVAVLAYAAYEGRVRARSVLVGIIGAGVLFCSFSVVSSYRELVRRDHPAENATPQERVLHATGMFWAAAENAFSQITAGEDARATTTRAVTNRLGALPALAQLLQFSGGNSPYQDAVASLWVPAGAFLPRSVVPDKPVYFGSAELARMNGWKFGGISVSLVGSFYWAWGYAGVVMGMLAIGAWFGMIVRAAAADSRTAWTSQVVYVQFLLVLLDPGRTFQSITVDLLRFTALAVLLRSFAYLGIGGAGRTPATAA